MDVVLGLLLLGTFIGIVAASRRRSGDNSGADGHGPYSDGGCTSSSGSVDSYESSSSDCSSDGGDSGGCDGGGDGGGGGD